MLVELVLAQWGAPSWGATSLPRIVRQRPYVLCDLFLQALFQDGIDREQSRSKDEHHERGEEERVLVRDVKLARIGEERHKGIVVGRPVGDQHAAGEQETDEARPKPKNQQDAPEELQPGAKVRVERRKRNVEAGEEIGDPADVVQLAPAGLRELPAPVEPNGEQKRGLQIGSRLRSERVPPNQELHLFSLQPTKRSLENDTGQ
jgi:hypothetical protein